MTQRQKKNYQVVKTTPSEEGEFENLTLEIWTDSTKTPLDCVKQAASVLLTQFMIISKASEKNQDDNNMESEIWRQLSPEQYNTTIELLDLSSRTLNCLKRASLDTVGQIIETKRSELLKIRNFGVKSFNELNEKFNTMGFLPEGFTWTTSELENPENTNED